MLVARNRIEAGEESVGVGAVRARPAWVIGVAEEREIGGGQGTHVDRRTARPGREHAQDHEEDERVRCDAGEQERVRQEPCGGDRHRGAGSEARRGGERRLDGAGTQRLRDAQLVAGGVGELLGPARQLSCLAGQLRQLVRAEHQHRHQGDDGELRQEDRRGGARLSHGPSQVNR